MSEKCIILGCSGMLGKALTKVMTQKGYQTIGLARKNAELTIDITDRHALLEAFTKHVPDIIINTVADVNLSSCEKNPLRAYKVNAEPSKFITQYTVKTKSKYVFISTDHFFTNKQKRKNSETSEVSLCNQYAKSKYQGELYSLTDNNALIIRTNIVGFRHVKNSPSFVEWIIKTLSKKQTITAFKDYYTSSIDVTSFSISISDLLEKNHKGIINLASSDVNNKLTFIQKLADGLEFPDSDRKIVPGSIKNISDEIIRNESSGLDVTKAEQILGYKLPRLDQVINSLVSEHKMNR